MDILFLLVPLSVALALAVMGVLAWAIASGQFEDIEVEGQRIMGEEGAALNIDVAAGLTTGTSDGPADRVCASDATAVPSRGAQHGARLQA